MTYEGKERRLSGGHLRRITAAALAIVLAFMGWDVAQAQDRWLWGPDAGFVSGGLSAVQTADLNSRLEAQGYPSFGRTALVLGVGAYWALPGGMLMGGEGYGTLLGTAASGDLTVGVDGGFATVGIAYIVTLSQTVRLYPRLGLGGGGLALSFEREEAPAEFDQVLENPRPTSRQLTVMSRESAIVDLGAGAEILPGGRERGAMIGLRFGYLMAPGVTRWRLVGRMVDNGPKVTLSGPYIRLTMGVRRK